MTVSVSKRGPSRRDRYTRGAVQTDTVQFRLEGVDFVLRFKQAILQDPHQPTERELARAHHGHVFPDFDNVPDQHLEIELEGDGASSGQAGGKTPTSTNWKTTLRTSSRRSGCATATSCSARRRSSSDRHPRS